MPFPSPGDIAGAADRTISGPFRASQSLKKADIPDGVWLPHVAEAVRILAGTFDVPASTYAGHGVQPGGASTAADFLMGTWYQDATGNDKAKGDSMAGFLDDNWAALNINYVIWQDQIKGPQTGGSWIAYPHTWKEAYGSGDDNSPSVRHTDHVHVSFNQSGSIPDITKLTPPTGSWLQRAARDAAGSLGDLISRLPEIIASGFANALLRFVKAVYAYTILRPIDFISGFWWELTKLVTGYKDQATGKEGTEKDRDPNVFSERNRKRLWSLLFVFSTYYLAFGRDKNGDNHLDKLLNSGADLANRDLGTSGRYNDVARIRADVQGVTVARRRAKHTTRRGHGGKGVEKHSGAARRRVPTNVQRDRATGRFVGRKEKAQETQRRGETQRPPEGKR